MKRTKQKDERGIVSFIVALIIMIVISILVVSFSRLARREQRQSLDNQLSTQAYYSAESGINDAVRTIQQKLQTNSLGTISTTTCYDNEGNKLNSDPAYTPLDGSGNIVKYSCLIVSPVVKSILYSPLTQQVSRVFPVQAGNGVSIDSLSISWQDSAAGGAGIVTGCGTMATNDKLPTSLSALSPACQVGMLEVDIVPTNGPKGLKPDRNSLIANDYKIFLVPSAGGTVTWAEIKPL